MSDPKKKPRRTVVDMMPRTSEDSIRLTPQQATGIGSWLKGLLPTPEPDTPNEIAMSPLIAEQIRRDAERLALHGVVIHRRGIDSDRPPPTYMPSPTPMWQINPSRR